MYTIEIDINNFLLIVNFIGRRKSNAAAATFLDVPNLNFHHVDDDDVIRTFM